MADKLVAFPDEILASKIMASVKAKNQWSDYRLKETSLFSASAIHFHGGLGSPIAWNDVQETIYYNRFLDPARKLDVPSYPSVGYNQHGHTSEYDGGVIPGIMGNHSHADGNNGGLAFACFYPATGLPQADWAL